MLYIPRYGSAPSLLVIPVLFCPTRQPTCLTIVKNQTGVRARAHSLRAGQSKDICFPDLVSYYARVGSERNLPHSLSPCRPQPLPFCFSLAMTHLGFLPPLAVLFPGSTDSDERPITSSTSAEFLALAISKSSELAPPWFKEFSPL